MSQNSDHERERKRKKERERERKRERKRERDRKRKTEAREIVNVLCIHKQYCIDMYARVRMSGHL